MRRVAHLQVCAVHQHAALRRVHDRCGGDPLPPAHRHMHTTCMPAHTWWSRFGGGTHAIRSHPCNTRVRTQPRAHAAACTCTPAASILPLLAGLLLCQRVSWVLPIDGVVGVRHGTHIGDVKLGEDGVAMNAAPLPAAHTCHGLLCGAALPGPHMRTCLHLRLLCGRASMQASSAFACNPEVDAPCWQLWEVCGLPPNKATSVAHAHTCVDGSRSGECSSSNSHTNA